MACDKDDDRSVAVTVNGTVLVGDRSDFNGAIDASFTGVEGSDSRSFIWNNNLSTADYNTDIITATVGTFQITVEDSEGSIVLNRTIDGGTEPDTTGGVTSSGVSGI
ncbi:hypothetical protein [Maribacter antarcticus]|uniref:hypothetical protein n=1 Tax=Maribacter antarcticus TaxID=505250 RepID=UPI001FE01AF2|nr:hypothetical protein [Maribacter antarcticus]